MKSPRYFSAAIVFAIGVATIIGSANTRSSRINDVWEKPYIARYEFDPGPKAENPSEYTIGIIQTQFAQNEKASWYYEQKHMHLVEPFQREISNGIEKVLINKGCKVAGPFRSYEDMTFPERDRCDFLIAPKLFVDLNFQPFRNTLQSLDNVGGPNLENYSYAKMNAQLDGRVEMEYVILDPLTAEKLERHKLITENVSETVTVLMQAIYDNKTNKFIDYKPIELMEKEIPQLRGIYSGYANVENVSKRMFERLYNKSMPEINRLVSVGEFDHLKAYQQKLEQKKRY